MISEARVKELIIQTLELLQSEGQINDNLALGDNTKLIGMESTIDSMGFVEFLVGLERAIEQELGEDFILVMHKVHDLNEGKPNLIIKDLAKYIALVVGEGS